MYGESHLDIMCPHIATTDAVGFCGKCTLSIVMGSGSYNLVDARVSDVTPDLEMCGSRPRAVSSPSTLKKRPLIFSRETLYRRS
jgi:hypothetical protein